MGSNPTPSACLLAISVFRDPALVVGLVHLIARELAKDAGLVGDSKRREAIAAQR